MPNESATMVRNCQWERIGPDKLRCVHCRHPRRWTRDDVLPKRNCEAAAPVPPEVLRGILPPLARSCGGCYEEPGIGRKIWNLAGAATRFAEAVVKGDPKLVTREAYDARLKVCDGCPLRDLGTCTHPECGCFIAVKARLATEHCPLGKWAGDDQMRNAEFGMRSEEGASLRTPHSALRTRLLFRFAKGLGDSFTFTAVLKHLRELRPDIVVDVECRPRDVRLFAPLVREARQWWKARADGPQEGYELYQVLDNGGGYPIGKSLSVNAPGTAAEQYLRTVLGIEPRAELCRYWVPEVRNAEFGMRSEESASTSHSAFRIPHSPYVVVHHRGASDRGKKDVAEADLRPAVEWLLEEGFRVLVLDDKGTSQLASVRSAGCAPQMIPRCQDAVELVELCRGAALCIGIDSGPGHAMAASGAKSVIITHGKHPYHCFEPAENTIHLLADDHEKLVKGLLPETADGWRAWFNEHYAQRTYPPGRLAMGLLRLVRDVLRRGVATAARWNVVRDVERGLAWQADRSNRVPYDAAYFEKYASYRGTPIARRINRARVELVRRHTSGKVLDVGIGSGEFLESIADGSYGFDVNPTAIAWLTARGCWAEPAIVPSDVTGWTFWDSLEHLRDPAAFLDQVSPGELVFVSLPVFDDLTTIDLSRHYLPDEHLWYWTAEGFRRWMAGRGFLLLEENDTETEAGRESVGSFAFRRLRPGESVLVTGGIGDFVAVESLTPADQRQKVRQVFLATRGAAGIRALLAAHPDYRHWQVEELPAAEVYHRADDVRRLHADRLPTDVTDWSIAVVFPQGTGRFAGSSFLALRLADVSRFHLPPGYWAIHPSSPNEREDPPRDMDDDDWRAAIAWLAERDAMGVVLGTGDDPVPEHPRLLNLTNRASLPEAVEILKGAAGFLGCASSFSVLAAQLFPAGRLRIKGRNPHLLRNLRQYYAPRREFSFVVSRFGGAGL